MLVPSGLHVDAIDGQQQAGRSVMALQLTGEAAPAERERHVSSGRQMSDFGLDFGESDQGPTLSQRVESEAPLVEPERGGARDARPRAWATGRGRCSGC